jgi:pyridoxine 4-dehydrogenase
VREVEKVATSKGCTPGQVALAWVKAHSEAPGLPAILPIPGTTREERLAENMKAVMLDASELNELNDIVKNAVVAGERYPEAYEKLCYA